MNLKFCRRNFSRLFSDPRNFSTSKMLGYTVVREWMRFRKHRNFIESNQDNIILWRRNVYCETEWIYIDGKVNGSVFYFWVSCGSKEEQLAISWHTWFILSVEFPAMFLGLLNRKSEEECKTLPTQSYQSLPHAHAQGVQQLVLSVFCHLSVSCQHKNCHTIFSRY